MFKNLDTDFFFKIEDRVYVFIYSLPTMIANDFLRLKSPGAIRIKVKSSAHLRFQNIERKEV